uniref:Uncharacterized protein n=1 Tax=Chrysotila carterae TaxID=13221 RepID=A0A7S4F5L6_CHRCT
MNLLVRQRVVSNVLARLKPYAIASMLLAVTCTTPLPSHAEAPLGTLALPTGSRGDAWVLELREDARSLSLPAAERERERALQALEDERLAQCRTERRDRFDQCFFFGKRPPDASAAQSRSRPLLETAGRDALRQQRAGVPTW